MIVPTLTYLLITSRLILAQSSTPLQLTETQLKAHDGTDPTLPIYLGINGLIFDVSSSPSFYGPGGHYHHFVGKDATRAWVTECWDEEEQFTWRMDEIEVMFMPKWMDEQMENISNSVFDDGNEDWGGMPRDAVVALAKKVTARFGTVGEEEKVKRRKEDKEVAAGKVKEAVDHWVNFFSGNAKYKQVGTVIRDESREAPPKPCDAAMKKRPTNFGKLEAVAGSMGNLFGGGGASGAGGKGGKSAGAMPESVKKMLAQKAKDAKTKVQEVVGNKADDSDASSQATHDEL